MRYVLYFLAFYCLFIDLIVPTKGGMCVEMRCNAAVIILALKLTGFRRDEQEFALTEAKYANICLE